MGVINTNTHPKLLWPGIKAIWGDYFYNRHPEEFSKIFDVDTSDMAFEEHQGITGFGLAPQKTEGAAIIFDDEKNGYNKRYTHVAYALGYIVTREELDDNLYEKVSSRRAPAVARSMRQTVETVNANHLNRATSGSYLGPDGVALLSTAHPNINGGTWSNRPSSATDLSEASIEDLVIQIMNTKDDRGLHMQLMPKSLIVPTNEYFNAHRILDSVGQSGTANNDANVLKSQGVFPDGIVMNHYLTDTDAWFIKTDCMYGLTHLWRTKPVFDKDNDFNTKNLLASGYMRFSSGWTDARGVFGSPGA